MSVHDFPTAATLTPDQALESAKKLNFTECVIIGHDADGKFNYLTSRIDRKSALWLIEKLKHVVLDN